MDQAIEATAQLGVTVDTQTAWVFYTHYPTHDEHVWHLEVWDEEREDFDIFRWLGSHTDEGALIEAAGGLESMGYTLLTKWNRSSSPLSGDAGWWMTIKKARKK